MLLKLNKQGVSDFRAIFQHFVCIDNSVLNKITTSYYILFFLKVSIQVSITNQKIMA